MENILEINSNFDFSKIYLDNPLPLQGGSFFTKINYSDKKLPLYIQLPKSKSKNGIIKSSTTKKIYIDLLFNYHDKNLLTWFENLEIRCRELIFEKKDNWFQSDMDLDDIENMFITPIRSYKSGKFLNLRVNIPNTKNIKNNYCMIYDETEKIISYDDVTSEKNLIPLVLIDGIKFTTKTFQLEINLPQLMVLNIENDIKNNFMIKTDKIYEKEKTCKTLEKYDNLEDNTEEDIRKQDIKQQDNSYEDNLKNKLKHNLEEDLENNLKKENLEDNLKENLEDKLEGNLKENLEDKLEGNLEDNLEENLEDNLKKNTLEEINLEISNNLEKISLKNPLEVYKEIYLNAKIKAKNLKESAINAYLEAKEIKIRYNLSDSENSDEDILENI